MAIKIIYLSLQPNIWTELLNLFLFLLVCRALVIDPNLASDLGLRKTTQHCTRDGLGAKISQMFF